MGQAVAVGCFLFSLVLFLIAGLYWLKAKRMLQHTERRLRRVKEILQVSRGNRDAKPRMRMREVQGQGQEAWQRRGPFSRYRPAAPNARPQGSQKRKKAITKIYGGIG